MGQGEFARVKEHLEAASQKPPIGWNPVGDHEIYVLLADFGAMHRNKELLSKYALHSNETSLSLNHLLYHAIALRALGVLDWQNHDFAQAEDRLNESYRIFQQLETHWQIGRTLFDLGELYVEMGRLKDAKKYFAQAQSAFRTMGVLSNQDVPD